MIKEEDIEINYKTQDLLNLLFKEGLVNEESKKGFKITYLGKELSSYIDILCNNFPITDKEKIDEIISHLENKEDTRNFILFIKYREEYIGGLSILNLKYREGFGLNKYLNNSDRPFYLGQWKENQKSGLGFLKIDNDHFYIGEFSNNQMSGDGFYYNKKSKNNYFGKFNNGIFKKGLFFNLSEEIYYIGKFRNNKKNDNFCCYINYKKKKLFFGEIKNDLFIKGQIFFMDTEEKGDQINITIKNNFSYDNGNKINIKSKEKYHDVITSILSEIINLESIISQIIDDLLVEYENIYDDNSYNNGIGRYNNYENNHSFENEFIENYNNYFNELFEIKNKLDLEIEEIQKKI